MAITIRVPDPTEDYDVSNQRQIVRAINNFIQQINAQYKPEGDTFSEIEQLSYFLGYSPSKPAGPATSTIGGTTGGIIWSKIDWATSFFSGSGGGFGPGGSFQASRNRGYLISNIGYSPDPPIFNLPVEPPIGTQVGVVNGGGYGVSISAGVDSNGYQIKIDGFFTVSLSGYGRSRTYVYFGDGGYPAGYAGPSGYYKTWYSISKGYN